MEARPLPPHPNMEQYKKQAKDLLKACTSAEPRAIRAWAGQWFESCANDWVETEARLRGITVTQRLCELLEHEVVDRIEKNIRASKLSKPNPRLADAQFFVARAHGFDSWPKFAKQVEALQSGNSRDARFEAAADAVISGDIRTLERLLRGDPQLILTRSQRVHSATVLHYVAANGVEDFRQKTPKNIGEIAKLLLDAGADVNAESKAYGGGSTTLGLVATSVHPERAGVQEQLMQVLLDHGAIMDRPGVAGNRHTAVEGCLWNGRGKAARFLASRGARLDLETAAGVGKFDVVKGYFSENGALKPGATEEQLQRGFLWACGYGHNDVVDFLLARGADLRDQANTGETALHFAVVGGELSTIKLLLERGAPLEELNGYGGTALGQAGWSFLNGDPEIDYVPVFETLLGAGAKIEDGWLAWLDKQESRPATAKARIAEVLRRYGAAT
jgi:ankyrin repeat protein